MPMGDVRRSTYTRCSTSRLSLPSMKFIFLFLCPFVCLALDVALSEVAKRPNLGTEHEPTKPLGIRLDMSLINGPLSQGVKKPAIVFSSYLQFRDNVNNIPDNQLVEIARDALKEMSEMAALYGVTSRGVPGSNNLLPNVMSLLAVDQYIFLSSSQKGTNGYTTMYPESKVSKTLGDCMLLSEIIWNAEDPQCRGERPCRHVNDQKCGEIMAVQAYYRKFPDQELKGRGGRIVAVSYGDEPQLVDEGIVIRAPCGRDPPKDGPKPAVSTAPSCLERNVLTCHRATGVVTASFLKKG